MFTEHPGPPCFKTKIQVMSILPAKCLASGVLQILESSAAKLIELSDIQSIFIRRQFFYEKPIFLYICYLFTNLLDTYIFDLIFIVGSLKKLLDIDNIVIDCWAENREGSCMTSDNYPQAAPKSDRVR